MDSSTRSVRRNDVHLAVNSAKTMGLLTEGGVAKLHLGLVIWNMALSVGELQVADMQKHFRPQMRFNIEAAANLKSVWFRHVRSCDSCARSRNFVHFHVAQ